MVKNCKEQSKRGEWSQQTKKESVDKVFSKESGYIKTYSVPQTTLELYVEQPLIYLWDQ